MRKHYVDNLRWIATFLLIPYHAAMAWNVWGEPNYIFIESNKTISSIVVFFSPYFMPLLFLLAGISTRFSLNKRTNKEYISERAKRLLVPFLSGTLLFMPIMTFIAEKFNYTYNGSFFQHYLIFFTKFTDLTGADGGFSLGQFWFLLYLFIISIISVGIIKLHRKNTPECIKAVPLWLICTLGLPLPLLHNILSIGGKSIAEYTYIFIIGYYVFSDDSVVSKSEKYKWLFLSVGLTATFLNVYLFIWSDLKFPLLNTSAKFISEWFMLISLIGTGKKYLEFNGKISRYMSHISFSFYSLHFIWVVFFQSSAYGIFSNNPLLLYTFSVVLSYITTFICCEICIRIPFLRFLTGTKIIYNNKF